MSDNTKHQQRDETADTVLYITASTKQDFNHLFQTTLKKMVYEPHTCIFNQQSYAAFSRSTLLNIPVNAQHDTLKQVYHA